MSLLFDDWFEDKDEITEEINAGMSNHFQGLVDEAAAWDVELTAAEVNAIYNGGVPGDLSQLARPPVGWWRACCSCCRVRS